MKTGDTAGGVAGHEQDIVIDLAQVPGLAVRPTDFEQLETLCTAFDGANGFTTAAVTGLVLRTIRRIEHFDVDGVSQGPLPLAAVLLLAQLVEMVYDDKGGLIRWSSGEARSLMVFPGNGYLERMMGVEQRTIRRLLKLLEEHHWIVRRYNKGNKRKDVGGIDLRPLAARLQQLQEAWMTLTRDRQIALELARAERDDLEALQMAALSAAAGGLSALQDGGEDGDETSIVITSKEQKGSGREDRDVHLKSYKLRNPGSTSPVQKGAPQVEGGVAASRTGPNRFVPDDELMALMVAASPTLQRSLGAGELINPSPVAVARAVTWILRSEVKLRPGAWEAGIKQHGFAALAAVVVAVDREGVDNPAGYLHAMLKAARLRTTVMHSLRRLLNQPTGRA